MQRLTLGEQLATIEHASRGLRAAGITHLIIDGDRVEICLAPPDPPMQIVAEQGTQDKPLPDPLDDPDTYGGAVPNFNVGADLATDEVNTP